jgi:hypothetical protein
MLPGTKANGHFDYGFPFDSAVMEDEEKKWKPDQKADVEMVICPALVRFGSRDGDKYKTYTVVQKAQVHLQRPSISRMWRESRDASQETSREEAENPFDDDSSKDGKGVKEKFNKFFSPKRGITGTRLDL